MNEAGNENQSCFVGFVDLLFFWFVGFIDLLIGYIGSLVHWSNDNYLYNSIEGLIGSCNLLVLHMIKQVPNCKSETHQDSHNFHRQPSH